MLKGETQFLSSGFEAENMIVWICGCGRVELWWDIPHEGTAHNGNDNNIYVLGTVPHKTHLLSVVSVVLCLTIKLQVRMIFIKLNHSDFLAQPNSFLSRPGVMAEC